jgi:hypothetical protein
MVLLKMMKLGLMNPLGLAKEDLEHNLLLPFRFSSSRILRRIEESKERKRPEGQVTAKGQTKNG